MAIGPTIASTANRRLLPTADLQIGGGDPAAFGAAIGQGLQQIGDAGAEAGGAVAQFQRAKQAEEDRLANFDRQTTFVNFGSDQSAKLEEAARATTGPAQDFTKTVMSGFDADSTKFLEAVPPRDRPAWTANMAKLRAGVASDALRTEFAKRDDYYKTTITDSLEKLQNGATQSPDKLADWQRQGEEIINSSGLPAQDKFDAVMRWRGAVSVAAATGDVQRDPIGALKRLGGVQQETRTEARTGAPKDNNAGNIVDGEYAKSQPGYVGPGRTTASGYTFAKFSTPEAGDAAQENLLKKKYIAKGIDTPREIINKYSPPGAPGNSVPAFNNYLAYIKQHAGIGPDDKVDAANLPAFLKAQREFEQGTGSGSSRTSTTVVAPAKAPEVDPRYAELPFDARQQLIGAAQREIERRQSVAAAGQQQAHASWLNNFLTEINDGKAGTADVEAARKAGLLTDIDEITRAQNMIETRDKEHADLNFFNAAAAAPGFAWNPFDDKQQKGVDAAVKQMGGSPQAAFNVWLKTGILAKAGGVALRGSLLSTDGGTVKAAASIASNMLARNPNAFAAVEGGSEIEKSALLYGHFVNDLGYSPDDAAARVASANSPEMRKKVAMGKPEETAFRQQLQKTDVEDVLSNAMGGWFSVDPEFTSPGQKTVAAQDYADIAADHFAQYGDPAAAKSYALAQMKKLYGVSNGAIMKFPPTKAYPVIGGDETQGYIFRQAAADIKSVTGRNVDPSKVYLMPLPTATAEAFRAGKPAPYAVHYADEVDGQPVYRVLNGKAFFADPREEARRIGKERAAGFEAARKAKLDPNTPLYETYKAIGR